MASRRNSTGEIERLAVARHVARLAERETGHRAARAAPQTPSRAPPARAEGLHT
jgi:hypothetical protein